MSKLTESVRIPSKSKPASAENRGEFGDSSPLPLKKYVEGASHLPTLPRVVNRLITAINDPRSTVKDIAKLLKSDQTLSMRLLKLANSVFYGLTGKVSTVDHAVVILGLKTIRSMALAIWTQTVKDGAKDIDELRLQNALFKHGLATGVLARGLCARIDRGQAEDCFVCGLLHDIGRVALVSEEGAAYERNIVDTSVDVKCRLAEMECAVFGFDHAELGAELLRTFHLPDSLVRVVAEHLRVDVPVTDDDLQLAAVVYANHLTEVVGCRSVKALPTPISRQFPLSFGLDDIDTYHEFLKEMENDLINLLGEFFI